MENVKKYQLLADDVVKENSNKRSKKKKRKRYSSSESSSSSSCSNSLLKESQHQYLKIKIDKTKIFQKLESLQQKIKLLTEENKNLKKENHVLRSNNVKFQVEIYNLQNQNTRTASETIDDENSYEELEILDFESAPEEVPSEVFNFPENISGVSFAKSLDKSDKTVKSEIMKEDPLSALEEESRDDEDYFPNDSAEMAPKVTSSRRKRQRKSNQVVMMRSFTLPPPTETQQEVLNKFEIKIPQKDLNELNAFESGFLNDQKFINKLLTTIFDKKTLAESSVTGKPSNNANYKTKHIHQFDPHRKQLITELLEERLSREELTPTEQENRMKRLNYMIRSKINNIRKHYFKNRDFS